MAITIDGDSGVSGVNGSATTPALQGTDSNTGIVFGTDTVQVATGGSTRATVDSSGNCGIGTASPQKFVHLSAAGSSDVVTTRIQQSTTNTSTDGGALLELGGTRSDGTYGFYGGIKGGRRNSASDNKGYLAFFSDNNDGQSLAERMRLDDAGRLLVNKTGSPGAGDGSTAYIFIQGKTTEANGPGTFALARGQSASEMSSGATLGAITFTDDTGNDFAQIKGACDGSAGTDDHPGRITFLTTPNGSSSPQERLRITEVGFSKFTNTGTYLDATGQHHEFNSGNAGNQTLIVKSESTVFTSNSFDINVVKSASSGYKFLRCASGDFGDTEFYLRGDGNAYADGTWSGGGADYAEYFEWSDGNTASEDRRGISVVLDGDKIREAVAGEEPIGVISGNPSVVGDADMERWKGKYLRDDYGTYIEEDYEVEDEDGNTVVQQRRQLNPDYNPDTEYVSRENRPEWDTVGLMGKLRIRKGQVTGTRWIKMRDISDTVEEWLVR